MNATQYKEYFSGEFRGMNDVIDKVFTPIFGEFTEKTNPTEIDYADESHFGNGGANIDHIYDYGTYYTDSTNVSVFEVVLSDNCQISRARKNIQNTVRKIMGHYAGAFIIFHYADGSNNSEAHTWRLSWLKRLDVHRKDSPAKRYTYLCGPSYSCRTIAQRLDELQKTSSKTLDSITKAFDVEALSDEFFYNYRALYSKLLGDGEKGKSKYKRYKDMVSIPDNELGFCDFIERHKGDTRYFGTEFNLWSEKSRRDYIKKLMGRLVFLQFLQKKGWMCGNHNYIKLLFESHVKANNENVTDITPGSFLDNVLKPLFFGVLNTKIEDREVLFTKEGWDLRLLKEWRNIPYLNGGLFEQEVFDKPKSAFPNIVFNELLTLFSEYNFTIDENDPNDAEVGIDPEMLGKIFESQLEDNKDKGAFYTPKEIVQYMCKESLIAYLQTIVPNHNDEIRLFVEDSETKTVSEKEKILDAVRKVKICDPAIGSGAFPMGLLNLLVSIREKLGDQASRYDQKKEIIQNNIFGVDIEKGAVDIARLRFWLSIVIDEENDNPHALPNLDYQIVNGNSLVHRFSLDASFKDVFSDYNKQHNTQYNLADYKTWVAEYLNTTDHTKKKQFREKIEEVKACFRSELTKKEISKEIKLKERINNIETATLFGLTKDQKKQIAELKKQLKELKKKHQDIVNNNVYKDAFEWRFEFPQLLNDNADFIGFDIVIGNPPYIKEYTNRAAFDGFRDSPYYMGKMDLWYGFACFGIDLLRYGGVLCFIAQNNWTTSGGAKKMRNKIMKDTRILQMLDFNDNKVFASAGIQTMVMLFEHNSIIDDYIFDHRSLEDGATKKEDMVNLLKKMNCNTKYKTPRIIRAKYYNKLLTFSDEEQLFDNISKNKVFFQDDEIAQGIVFPQDFLDKNGAAKLNYQFSVGCGVFGLSNTEKQAIRFTAQEESLIKPYFTTEQIHRYYTLPDNTLWLIYTNSSFKKTDSMDNYPNIKKHLDQFLPIITSDNKPYGLHRCRKEVFFKDEKIISLRKCPGRPCFSYSDFDCYVTQTFFSIKTSRWNMKFLTGVLNSDLIAFWLKNKGKMQGSNYQVDKAPLKGIPLPLISLEKQQPFIILVNQILTTKKANPQADTTTLERKIDVLVYLLYGLTWDEVQVVENSSVHAALPVNEVAYTQWLERYQKDGTLPSEEEMEHMA